MRMPFRQANRKSAAKRLGLRSQMSRRFESLEPRRMLASDLVISEFMAVNDTSLVDSDGDPSDWIEIHNPTNESVNLDGWFLTDRASDLDKWEFPAATIEADDYLIVFASNKNRITTELHTNFKLSGAGEYLALVQPDGSTITTEFNTFPRQLTDVSYGLGTDADGEIDPTNQHYFPTATPGDVNAEGVLDLGPIIDDVQHEILDPSGVTVSNLVDASSLFQTVVPTNDSLGVEWTQADYTPGANGETWSPSKSGGIGFDVEGTFGAVIDNDIQADMLHQNATAYIRTEFDWSGETLADRLSLGMKYDDGFIAYLNGTEVARRNAPTRKSPPSGLTTYYSFDGDLDDHASDYANSSSTVEDDFTALTAASTHNVNFAEGRNGQAVVIGRSDNNAAMLTAADSDDLDLAENWTVEAFVKPDSSNTGEWDRFATKWAPESSWHWAFRGTSNRIDLFLNGGQVIHQAATATVPLNEWSHVAITGDKANGKITAWLNGKEVGSANYIPVQNGSAPLTLGNFVLSDAGLQYSGLVDDFAIWNVALSADQLLAHANDGSYGLVVDGQIPAPNQWQANASAENPDAAALLGENIDISQHVALLQPGANVLAIHGLNATADDGDFLIAPTLTAETGSDSAEPLLVTANVQSTFNPIDTVTLSYRVMFDAERSISMLDNGFGMDAVAGDGIYSATIPGRAEAGEMVRYYVSAMAVDPSGAGEGVASRVPTFADPTNSAEYFGTVLPDPTIDTALPVLHRFIENEAAAETRTGTRGTVYYDGELYDNVFIRIRGGTAVSWPKKAYKIEFNDDHHFQFDDAYPRVDEFNQNTTYTDKSYTRAILAHQLHDAVGSPSSITFAMHVRQNGEFFSVAHFVEQPDRDFLRRNDLDPDGSLYKGNANPTNGFIGPVDRGAFEKKTRLDEGFDDLQEFVDGLALEGEDLETYIFDNVDLAAQINFMAVNVIMQNIDATDKNFYIYRDTEGDGEWQMLPWDLDLTYGPNALNTDTIVFDEDGRPAHTSHPYLGSLEFPFHGRKNHLFDAILTNPRTNEMFLRRLRTMMDEILTATDTPDDERPIEGWIDDLVELLGPDVLLDRDKWQGSAHFGGRTNTLLEAVDRIKNEYLAPRRTHLFETHSVDNTIEEVVTIFDESANKRAFVPTDDSLGLDWTLPEFDDSQWITGSDSVGFDRGNGFDALLGIDLLSNDIPVNNRIDSNGDGTNENNGVYIRIPFSIDDPTARDELRLKIRFDDGYVVYLNGTEVARNSAPDQVTWDSGATANRLDFIAKFARSEVDILQFSDRLVAGDNVLAIHGLTDTKNGFGSSSAMIFNAELLNGFEPKTIPVGIPHAEPLSAMIDFGAVEVSPASGNQDQEYIEFVNNNDFAVDVSNWRLSGGVDYTIQPGTVIPSGESLYLTPSLPAFRSRAVGPTGNSSLFAQGPYSGHLSSFGEELQLHTDDGRSVASIMTPNISSIQQESMQVSEIHYNPDDGVEFIELSLGQFGVSSLWLGGVTWTDGPSVPFTLPDTAEVFDGQPLIITNDVDAFSAAHPEVDSFFIHGPFLGSLANGGERIKFDDRSGNTIVDFAYNDTSLWPQAADGPGASLELIDLDTPADRLSNPSSWASSRSVGGTPAARRIDPVGVVISEVLAHTDTTFQGRDSIELHNPTSSPISIGGWYLSDSGNDLQKYRIPPGTTLAAGDYVVFDEGDFNPTPMNPAAVDFALSGANGDDVWLTMPGPLGGVSQFVDDVHFGPSELGQAIGLTENSNGRLVPTTRSTLGCGNGNPLVNDVVISEIHHAPAAPSSAALQVAPELDDNDLEYIEITAPSLLPLFDGWRIRGGVDFDFPTERSIANTVTTVIVTSFDPDLPENASRTAAFRIHHALDTDAVLIGGYSGSLNNASEQLRLERPVTFDGNRTFVMADEVTYDNVGPWPTIGLGESLQRFTVHSFGGHGSSWLNAPASAGVHSNTDTMLGDLNNDRRIDATDIDLLHDAVNRASQVPIYAISGGHSATRDDVAYLVENVLGTNMGDANLDGVVDVTDLNQVGLNWLSSDCSGWANGDFTGDGIVDAADLNIVGINWLAAPVANNAPAKIAAVRVTGQPLSYNFSVTIESDETGCDQYADWWEVISPGGELIYRRTLAHSHVNEQPFTRSGGSVRIAADEFVYVRVHTNHAGYGTVVYSGTVDSGFAVDSLRPDFADELSSAEPQPPSCAF